MQLNDRETAEALYCVSEVLARRQQSGAPIPSWMCRLHVRLSSSRGQDAVEQNLPSTRSITTRELAQRLGVSERQARRRAASLGCQKHGRDWLIAEDAAPEQEETK